MKSAFDDYSDYFKTQWWWDLKYKYLTCNTAAVCFICHNRTQLLLHHVNYKTFYKEKLNKDVYTSCFDCHTKIHFWFFRLIKVPLYTNALLFSMRLRKSIFCLHNRQLGLFLIWFLITFIIGSFYLMVWVVKYTLIILFSTFKQIVDSR